MTGRSSAGSPRAGTGTTSSSPSRWATCRRSSRRSMARAAADSRSRSSGAAGRRVSSRSRCSTPGAYGCARESGSSVSEPFGLMIVDGRPIEVRDGDSIAVAIVRAGEPPARGGTLCLAGDCGNCLAVVDDIAYSRTCQVPARAGTVVVRHPADGNPPLPGVDGGNLVAPAHGRDVEVQRRFVERVVVGRLDGDAEGDAVVLDGAAGAEVVGVYSGPTVIARMPTA